MTGIYYPDLLDVLRAAGCQVAESSTTDGWERRARSSGGFPSPPLGVQWHHTASSTTPANDLAYMIRGNADAPVGNLLLDRTGTYWPIAAGAANTAGKGGPLTLSRGTVPADQANSRTFAIEAANNGVGEPWPTVQVDAYFTGSNALNARFGNVPGDVFNHQTWAPTRKIDPATAPGVQGAWVPRSSTSSGTWSQADVTAECVARALELDDDDDDDKGDDVPRLYIGRDAGGVVWIGDRITRVAPSDAAIDAHLWMATIGGPAVYQPPSDEAAAAAPFPVTWRGEIPSPGQNIIEWLGNPGPAA